MSEETTSQETTSEEQYVSPPAEAAKQMVGEASKRVASFVARKAASTGSTAKDKVSAAGKRAAASASKKASTAGKAAMQKLVDTGIKLSQKQQAALEKVKARYDKP